MANHPPIVTLLTDFGLADEYVAVIKGVLLSHDRTIRIVDICHAIPPQQVATAAHLLERAWPYFPPDTVHLVIVDPEVGTDRPILALRSAGQYFIGPDNGLFSSILCRPDPPVVFRVTATGFFLRERSATFHGRDIMAPVAARLATGLPIDRLGPPVAPADCRRLVTRVGSVQDGVLQGEIVHVDRFGNLCTNISRQAVANFAGGRKLTIQVGGAVADPVTAFANSYAGQPRGALLALFDSHDQLEIAENMGSAARRLKAATGTGIALFRR